MTLGEVVLTGIVVSFLSGSIGILFGKNGKVTVASCNDHRKSCTELLGEKIDGLSKRIDDLKKAVDGKLLGL